MYILYAVEYPETPVTRAAFEAAWKAARVPAPVPTFVSDPIAHAAVGAVVRRTLEGHGAVLGTEKNVEMEVPDEQEELLARLEELYHRLYPERQNSGSRNHFHYERLEWLGQY